MGVSSPADWRITSLRSACFRCALSSLSAVVPTDTPSIGKYKGYIFFGVSSLDAAGNESDIAMAKSAVYIDLSRLSTGLERPTMLRVSTIGG